MSEVQSSAISKIKSLWVRLGTKAYREAFVSAKIDGDLAGQIYAMREQQFLTQEELGLRASMAQSRIAKLEGSCEGVSVGTLKRLAAAFDVALQIKFVPFSELILVTVRENLDRPVAKFTDDRVPADSYCVATVANLGQGVYLPNHRTGGRKLFREERINTTTQTHRRTMNA